ncbi:hypothetical protein F6R98_03480 [Candidatus Methylospira mobilis]|uniref:Uncharacterized protein n=1 Tax=Candidatus Methylospira mobilis TaxID=1808979 RepID=A0A5Q0BI22_9GAMM|nr:hypothetical protein [Candidatus Methylospira mobilis]QFY41804.1 hypothetical protein F6R98_03480 [Candidatus Methylospira mobilis]WNV06668.1 hypothetical protein RP726_09745 [Candidatus Methylospira mobilis]
MPASRVFWFLLFLLHALLSDAEEGGQAQARNATVHADLAARKTLVRNNLPLTESEAQIFWPIYEAYEEQIAKLGERRSSFMGKLGEDFDAVVTNEKAAQIIHDTLDQQQNRNKITAQYFKQLEQVLPGNKLLRYFQIEYQLRAITEAKIVQSIPLVP